jgi:hypothetical protein
MFVTYAVVTLLAATFVGGAALANLIGLDYSKNQADINRVPRSWIRPLGVVLAAGALGLLAGFAVPVLGILAAAGLVFARSLRTCGQATTRWAPGRCMPRWQWPPWCST